MPELPEVETTLRGIAPHLTGTAISAVTVRTPALRRPIAGDLAQRLSGQRLIEIRRRAKYLLLVFERGRLIIHLGMSGSLRIAAPGEPAAPHDHVDLAFGERILRYRDPRRFGLIQWLGHEEPDPPAIAALGIEPLDPAFDGAWLFAATRQRRTPIKVFLMDGRRIVGVGNIYASESLFRAGIDPRRAAGALSAARCARLAEQVRATLEEAIAAGGSTLRDFTGGDGRPGYFQHNHAVYGRDGEPCPRCATPIRRIVMAQRASFYCPRCQAR